MNRSEMIDILNGMCGRCLMNGMVSTVDCAKELCEVFDRFCNNNYTNDDEYSNDILYLYNLATKLHNNRYTSLEESYSIYSAILHADKVDFVETDVEGVVETDVEDVVKKEPVKLKRSKRSKVNDGVIEVSDIVS